MAEHGVVADRDPRIAVLTDPAAGFGALIDVDPERGRPAREASEQYAAEILAVLDRYEASARGRSRARLDRGVTIRARRTAGAGSLTRDRR